MFDPTGQSGTSVPDQLALHEELRGRIAETRADCQWLDIISKIDQPAADIEAVKDRYRQLCIEVRCHMDTANCLPLTPATGYHRIHSSCRRKRTRDWSSSAMPFAQHSCRQARQLRLKAILRWSKACVCQHYRCRPEDAIRTERLTQIHRKLHVSS